MPSINEFRHIGRIKLSGTITALTGLHIGGNETGLAIGGADKLVVRNALDGRPYLPGSSLRGKMRCLLARVYAPGKLEEKKNNNHPRLYRCDSAETYENYGKGFLFHLFGITPEELRKLETDAWPTRLIVRDASMSDETARQLETSLYTDMPLTQVKTEVIIDRITSAATPRQLERIPAGARFDFEMVVNLFHEQDLDLLPYVAEAMDLLEHDCLGGQGSRGYGQVRFTEREVEPHFFHTPALADDPRVTRFIEMVERAEKEPAA